MYNINQTIGRWDTEIFGTDSEIVAVLRSTAAAIEQLSHDSASSHILHHLKIETSPFEKKVLAFFPARYLAERGEK